MIKTYKYKLYKSKKTKHIRELLTLCCLAWNHCIALHRRYFRIYHKHLNLYTLQKHITKLKRTKRFRYMKSIPSQALQDITERIEKSYKLFFRNLKTKNKTTIPKFKPIRKYKSFTLKQSGYKFNSNKVRVINRWFKFSLSRSIKGKIKTLTIKRDILGDFYLYVCLEMEDEFKTRLGKSIGLDFGLKTFLTTNDGVKIKSPEFLKQSLNQIQKASKKVSSKDKGSNNRRKAIKHLFRVHKKIKNRRRDFFHKLSYRLSLEFDYVFVEDLNLKGMQKRWGRKLSDYGFNEFLSILQYKTNVVKIDRFFPSSKTCSNCKHVNNELSLSQRQWVCPNCNTKIDRDINAAKNILMEGASSIGVETVSLKGSNESLACFVNPRIPIL